jgi:Lon protease-like protein
MKSETTIPIFPLGLVLLPGISLPLHIFEERYKLMITTCLEKQETFGVIYFNGEQYADTGCTAEITKIIKRYDDGRMDILTRGQDRFRIGVLNHQLPYLQAQVAFFDDDDKATDESGYRHLVRQGLSLLQQYAAIEAQQETQISDLDLDATSASFLLAGCDGFSYEEKQSFLEMTSTPARLQKTVAALEIIIERERLTAEIQRIIGGNGNMAGFSTEV